MSNKTPAYLYSVSNLANEIKSHLETLLPKVKISHVNILNIISHACKYKNYQSMKNDNQSFEIKNPNQKSEDFRTKTMFSAESLLDSIFEIKMFIQTMRVHLLNDYLILERPNKYFTIFLPDDIDLPVNKINKNTDVTIEDLDNFILILKKHIDQKFSININLDILMSIIGNQLMININTKNPIGDYKRLFIKFYEDVNNDDFFSPKRIFTSYNEDSCDFEYGEKIGLIELTFRMISYQKACKLGFDFTDKQSIQYGDDTMLSNQSL